MKNSHFKSNEEFSANKVQIHLLKIIYLQGYRKCIRYLTRLLLFLLISTIECDDEKENIIRISSKELEVANEIKKFSGPLIIKKGDNIYQPLKFLVYKGSESTFSIQIINEINYLCVEIFCSNKENIEFLKLLSKLSDKAFDLIFEYSFISKILRDHYIYKKDKKISVRKNKSDFCIIDKIFMRHSKDFKLQVKKDLKKNLHSLQIFCPLTTEEEKKLITIKATLSKLAYIKLDLIILLYMIKSPYCVE